MRRRPSASNTDEDDDQIQPDDVSEKGQLKIQQIPQRPNRRDKAKRKNSRPPEPNYNVDSPPKLSANALQVDNIAVEAPSHPMSRRSRIRNPWATSWLTSLTLVASTALLLLLYHSFNTRQLDPKGGSMSYMASSFVSFPDFDTEHTRFATKYSLHMYRELGVDEDPRVKGVPVLFIPGNAGSYKQVRSLASEAEYFRQVTENHYIEGSSEKLALDFFTVDFNEDFTAFHGQTLLDQAEYLNDAIAYILSLYHNSQRSRRDAKLPDPSSVILVGHSMGGVVARTMLTMPNYQSNSVNTIITLSAPHARPPVTFDSQIVDTYKNVNDYWRKSHSKEWGMDNPLWHVTVISIAGGGLDTIVPSDYASISSLIPETHGFTVFTSSIPTVWTGMDHLAITWCDEFRKVVIRALFDVLDVRRSSQTKPRGERMSYFKKWFLTGLEPIAEKHLQILDPSTLLTLEDPANSVLQQGERLVLRGIGHVNKRVAHFLPVPPHVSEEQRRFTLLTNVDIKHPDANVEVLFCSVYPLQAGHSANLFTMSLEMPGDQAAGSTRLACKTTTSDFVQLPASTSHSTFPFDKTTPFSYLQYSLDSVFEHQFAVIVEKTHAPSNDFLIAEFTMPSEALVVSSASVETMLNSDVEWTLPSERPLLMDVQVPALESSLLSYKLQISPNRCGPADTMFRPLVRQYISDVYESKFFVNVDKADVNLHGVAPYMPSAMRSKDNLHGLSFQIWSDPTCKQPLHVSLCLDILGSFGKLWMRYRTMFATLPLFVIALVLARQFKIYDQTGIFISFGESMNQCARRELPALIIALILPAYSFSNAPKTEEIHHASWFAQHRGNATESLADYTMNNLLLGSPDPFFWFLIPIFGVVCIGLCIAVNYLVLIITYIFSIPVSYLRLSSRQDDPKKPNTITSPFTITSMKQRVVTTSILLGLVATVLPYQFAYLVLSIVQLVTAIRALAVTREAHTDYMYNFYNYSHSILILMLWILPINLPVLVVWIRNLALHWLTPFSSHHNILSIVPFILLIETGATGKMVPPMHSRLRYITGAILLLLAAYAALYGVSYAYTLHQVTNIFCGWLVLILWFTGSWELEKVIGKIVPPTEPKSNKKKP